MTFLLIIALGLGLGLRHALDPDHVVAVSAIVGRERSVWKGSLAGVVWGAGHTLTVLAAGIPLIVLRAEVPEQVSALLELCVAAMLIWIGVSALRASRRKDVEVGTTESVSVARTHSDEPAPARTWLRPMIVGMVHGLAGSAAVALTIMATIRDPFDAVVYLLLFGLGTIIGMAALSTAVALPVVLTAGRSPSHGAHLSRLLAFASVAFGIFLAVRIGVPLATA